MKKENFNFEGIQLHEGERAFVDDKKVQEFYEYLEAATKDVFESLETARKKSIALATKRFIG